MKSKIQTIYLNTPIEKALDILHTERKDRFCVLNHQNEKVGELFLETLLKAEKHHLNLYPVSLVVNYNEKNPVLAKTTGKQYIQSQISTLLSKDIQDALKLCSREAQKENIRVYLVGGIVRDLLRSEANLDVDLTFDASAIEFAQKLEIAHQNVKLKEKHSDFGTAKLQVLLEDKNIEIDLASTREEYYKYPGALPSILDFSCPLGCDLYRRDFTVNAMAININPQSYGELIDPYGGYYDLQNGILRVIHSYSFIDDPTRIIRGIKFAVRFNYHFSPSTERLARECINSGIFDNFCTDRLKYELKSLLNLNNLKVFHHIGDLKLYKFLDYCITWDDSYISIFEQLYNRINQFKDYINSNNIWIIYLGAMLHELPACNLIYVFNNLYLTKAEKDAIQNGLILNQKLSSGTVLLKPSEIYDFYNHHSIESILISTINYADEQIIDAIKMYLDYYSKEKINTTGETLINMGLSPGTIFSEILKKLLEEKLNGTIKTSEDEINYIKQNYLNAE